ncbi:MAG: EAL domain-containing protein [Nitrosomonas halophila]
MSYLRRFPIDIIKIDRSFAKDMGSDSDNSAIVTAIIALAKSLDLTVEAGGVETQAQLDFLHKAGCHHAQGYLFSHPVTADKLFALIEQRKTGTV